MKSNPRLSHAIAMGYELATEIVIEKLIKNNHNERAIYHKQGATIHRNDNG